MDLSEATKQLRAQVCGMLNALSADFSLDQKSKGWLSEKIRLLLVNNFLTRDEITTLMGWNRWEIEEWEKSNLEREEEDLSETLVQKLPILFVAVASKYNFSVAWHFAVPEQPVLEDRYELLYRPLSSFPVFKELSIRSSNALKNSSIFYVGDLVCQIEASLRRLPNIGKLSATEIQEAFNSLQLHLSYADLFEEEKREFNNRKWLHENTGEKLYLEIAYDHWIAPPELVAQLKQLGITERTQLATCPEEVLARFAQWRVDMVRMVNRYYEPDKFTLPLPIPRHLNPNVKVFVPTVGLGTIGTVVVAG